MMYRLGDEVILRIEEDFGYTPKSVKHVKVQVIGFISNSFSNDPEYLCYVPPYLSVPSSFIINKRHIKYYDVDPKFLDDTGCFITTATPVYKHLPALLAEKCDNCDEPVQGAVRDTFGVYVCRACRENPYR